MIKLSNFKVNTLKLNWETILIGLEGPGKFPPQITSKEVIDYAVDLISQEDNQPEDVWMLAGLSEKDTSEIKRLVKKLANNEKSVKEFELDKWKVTLLEKALNEISDKPIYGLIELTEFWEKFDFPVDSPHVIQGLSNNMSPEEYFTKENYDIIIKKHKNWIENKLTQLRGG